jgi:hypothetical protein
MLMLELYNITSPSISRAATQVASVVMAIFISTKNDRRR